VQGCLTLRSSASDPSLASSESEMTGPRHPRLQSTSFVRDWTPFVLLLMLMLLCALLLWPALDFLMYMLAERERRGG
jgi:hypothetical protein